MSLHLRVETGEEIYLEKLIRHRVGGPTYHPDVESSQSDGGLIRRVSGLDWDRGAESQPGPGVFVGGVICSNIYLRKTFLVLRLPTKDMTEDSLELITELGDEFDLLCGGPKVVDQVVSFIRELHLESLVVPDIPGEPEWITYSQ